MSGSDFTGADGFHVGAILQVGLEGDERSVLLALVDEDNECLSLISMTPDDALIMAGKITEAAAEASGQDNLHHLADARMGRA